MRDFLKSIFDSVNNDIKLNQHPTNNIDRIVPYHPSYEDTHLKQQADDIKEPLEIQLALINKALQEQAEASKRESRKSTAILIFTIIGVCITLASVLLNTSL